MNNKKKLGQFFTTNVFYILQGLEQHLKDKDVLDPFAGQGDLLNWAKEHQAKSIQGLDIDKTLCNNQITFNDSLVNIPSANFILTNPPYLAKNKMTKGQKLKYQNEYEDFYLLALDKIIQANPSEGIIIIPVNFFSAENSDKLRTKFLNKYLITSVNYFKQQVFSDTTYNVVAFHFIRHTNFTPSQNIQITSFPDQTISNFTLDQEYNYRIAGKELHKITSLKSMEITRLIEQHLLENEGKKKLGAFFNDKKNKTAYLVNSKLHKSIKNNIILLNCIDTNATEEGWIKAEDIRNYQVDCLVGKISSRNIAYVLIPIPNCPIEVQVKMIEMFNDILYNLRKQFKSLFLTNFRDNDRKRISFELCYKILTYCFYQLQE